MSRSPGRAARAAGIDESLFVRQIEAESSFQHQRYLTPNHAGAVGIAQIVPHYHPAAEPRNAERALTYAAELMARHLRKYGGSWPLALAAYNAGPGAVAQWDGVPPYQETLCYIERIMGRKVPAADGTLCGKNGARPRAPVQPPLARAPDVRPPAPIDPATGQPVVAAGNGGVVLAVAALAVAFVVLGG